MTTKKGTKQMSMRATVRKSPGKKPSVRKSMRFTPDVKKEGRMSKKEYEKDMMRY